MRRARFVWLTVEAVEAIHDRQLALGGLPGLRDRGLLASAVHAASSVDHHPSLAMMAAVYAYGLARNRPFVDANKRTALASATSFLRANGYPLRTTRASEDLIVEVAAGRVSRAELFAHFVIKMGGDVYINGSPE